MATYLKKGDKIKGDKIYCEALKINPLKPAPKNRKTQDSKNNVEK